MKIALKHILIISTLLYILPLIACTQKTTNMTGSVVSGTATSSSASAGNEQALNSFNNYIKSAYADADISVLSTANIGTDYMLVEFFVPTFANRFALCNLKTGVVEELPLQDAVLKKCVSENYFIFEDKGEFTDSAFRFFPSILRCFRVSYANQSESGNSNFDVISENELFKLDRTVQGGSKPNEVLSVINVTFNGLEVLFKPINGKEGGFYADATDIPPTTTAYDADKNKFTILMDVDQIGDQLKTGAVVKTDDNRYISSYQVVQAQGSDKVSIVVTLRDTAKRYMIEKKTLPDGKDMLDGFPYFTVNFSGEPDMPIDY